MNYNNPRYIAIISKSDETGGGASKIASDLANLLNQCDGIEAHHWYAYPGVNRDKHRYKLHGGKYLSRLQKGALFISRSIGFPDFFTPEIFIHWAKKKVDYDLYHFHDISASFSPLSLHWLSTRKPVIWTFHDSSPITGGCLYPMECRSLYTGCRDCPQLSAWPQCTRIDMTRFIQKYKIRLLKNGRVTIVSPSHWLASEVSRVCSLPKQPSIIPYSVDTELFKPIDKRAIRRIHNLSLDRFTIILSVWSLLDGRKGINYAIDGLKKMSVNPFVIALGRYNSDVVDAFRGIDTYMPGYIYDKALISQYYACSDVMLFPSLSDNLPNSILEAMACGVPTIAFRTGGIPELIDHMKNGWLADLGDAQQLISGVHYAASNRDTLSRWSRNCRDKAIKDYNNSLFITRHIALYENVLRSWQKFMKTV